MGKTTIIIMLFLLISCNKNSNTTRNDHGKATFVKANTFINSPGVYYFRDVSIIVKEFKDDTIIYGLSDYYNNLLYQRGINNSISANMKWTIYTDNNKIWFYNSDYQETNVFIIDGNKGTFIKDQKKLPKIPVELLKFIKD